MEIRLMSLFIGLAILGGMAIWILHIGAGLALFGLFGTFLTLAPFVRINHNER